LKDNPHPEGSDFFVGARLAARRQKAGIPIEKAAKDTRIPVARLRAIETDDFSSFPHPTYARMFLTDYASYLGVPPEDIRDYLPGGKNLGTTENTYLDVLLAKPGFLEGDQFKSIRRLLVAIGILVGLLLLVGAGIYGWRTWKKFERVKPTTLPVAATPAPTPTPEPSPALVLPPVAATPTPRGDSFTVMPQATPAATPQASPTPLTTLPPFEPAPRPRRPQ
jgi:cytoskeleton protein RodZ